MSSPRRKRCTMLTVFEVGNRDQSPDWRALKNPIRLGGMMKHWSKSAIVILAICLCAIQFAAPPCLAQRVPIKHVVIIIQEGRSLDTMFGQFAGLNGATSGDYLGTTVSLKDDLLISQPLLDGWNAAKQAIDGGKMDDFYYGQGHPQKSAYVQFHQTDISNYWSYAQGFGVADNFFASSYGGSFPNHLYTVAATSDSIIGNPDSAVAWGCDSPAGTTVLTITGQKIFPCISVPTLVGELNSAGLTWQYFAAPQGQAGYIWSALDAISDVRNSSQWTTNVLPVDQFASNALNGSLASVVWVTPPAPDSDSAPSDVCIGEDWTVVTMNTIMQSPDWASTVVFLTWSSYGGYYDHVAPPSVDAFGLGIRVPLVLISPYVKAGLVVHDQSEFSSLLAFAENVYGLAPLTSRDAAANNLMDAFDFSQKPLPPLILKPRQCLSSP